MQHGEVLGLMGYEDIKWLAVGLIFGLILAAGHFYLLDLSLKLVFRFTPKWGKFLVMILYYLRFAVLAVVLYLVLRLAGFTLALGIILGIMTWHLIWIVKNVKAFCSTKSPKVLNEPKGPNPNPNRNPNPNPNDPNDS